MKLLTLALLVLGGCQITPESFKALGEDHAAINMTIVTPWGVQRITRVNPTTNQTVIVSPDGSLRIDK